MIIKHCKYCNSLPLLIDNHGYGRLNCMTDNCPNHDRVDEHCYTYLGKEYKYNLYRYCFGGSIKIRKNAMIRLWNEDNEQ